MEQFTRMYKALSEEMRLRIVMLLTHGELCVCELMSIFDESQSKVSRHLAYLKNSGMVQSRRVGTWMHYSLREPLGSAMNAQLIFMKQQFTEFPVFREDVKKLDDIKKLNICG
ncbi:ArsR/SmtB family transcription factor [Syntrophus aciditrophicus]|uniref:Transcriptional regulator, ArsR family n=1 Tax=Syntrophus aciditrophicus (strain SB) TaxID=56780 RepID=Q2LXJ9_SYNAS|nr:metalloregulator ArsR/SmtB family transcription factor [Syntrophus aciditrophicus]ABC78808.1 transcriptional regulator, ArsR family [Syntrophus aciditrophicus SB]OPY13850.1 MAG: HTH-type transcriptional repressor AseR [Syntrophus sp. PtaB.Bin075]